MTKQQTPEPDSRGASVGIAIRASTPADVPALRRIYNHYVEHSHATFDTHPKTLAERQKWLAGFNTPKHRCLSAVDAQGQILGYACSGEFKVRPAYASSAEVSVYIAPTAVANGIGHLLYGTLLPLLDAAGIHRTYAGVALPNARSLRLHGQYGFREVGHFNEVGYKFDRYWDVVWLQRPTPAAPPTHPQ